MSLSGRQRHLRTKRESSEEPGDDEPEVLREKLEETKLLQRQRKRHTGLDASELLAARREATPSAAEEQLPAELMGTYVRAKASASVAAEDPHMRKFIEDELAKRLGKSAAAAGAGGPAEEEDTVDAKRRRLEQELYLQPVALTSASAAAGDSAVPGMLSGISEVALPREYKLRNIEETEAIKRRLLAGSGVGLDDEDGGGGGKIRRSQFPQGFGAQGQRKPKKEQAVADAEFRAHKYVSDPNLPRDKKFITRR